MASLLADMKPGPLERKIVLLTQLRHLVSVQIDFKRGGGGGGLYFEGNSMVHTTKYPRKSPLSAHYFQNPCSHQHTSSLFQITQCHIFGALPLGFTHRQHS